MRERNEDYLARKRYRDNKRKRENRAKERAARAPVAAPVTFKPNRHTMVFRRPVEMTKAEMYEMFATAAANTAALAT